MAVLLLVSGHLRSNLPQVLIISLVRLQTGTLAVFSPVTLSPEAKTTISSLGGNVGYIIAPDIEHHMQLGPWKAAYPNSKVIGPEGLREKRASQGNDDVVIDHIFTKENKHSIELPEDFAKEFDTEYFDGYAFHFFPIISLQDQVTNEITVTRTRKSPSSISRPAR